MIAYVCLGTSDLERATAYYNALLAPMGGKVPVRPSQCHRNMPFGYCRP